MAKLLGTSSFHLGETFITVWEKERQRRRERKKGVGKGRRERREMRRRCVSLNNVGAETKQLSCHSCPGQISVQTISCRTWVSCGQPQIITCGIHGFHSVQERPHRISVRPWIAWNSVYFELIIRIWTTAFLPGQLELAWSVYRKHEQILFRAL